MNTNISGNSAATMGADNLPSHFHLAEHLKYCLKVLGIGLETELGKQITEAVRGVGIDKFKNAQWLEVMKTIAEVCANKNRFMFTQSQLYDFLILATKLIGEDERRRYRVDEEVFKVYKDIMENYGLFEDSLRFQYPRIITDIAFVFVHGKDTFGREIIPHKLEKYIEERKLQLSDTTHDVSPKTVKLDQNLIQSLSQITGREQSSLVHLISRLDSTDIDKLNNICVNYDKLQKYVSLMDSVNEFKKEVEHEIGKKLTYNQLQHASVSVRKSRSYIENVLDGKFLPHGSHGINHIRHNLEYGYQVIGIIESKKRGSLRSR
jgi:hypothetical protein